MKEKLELVTNFAQLKPGVLVVIKHCGICRKNHRCMVTVRGDGADTFAGEKKLGRVPSWRINPDPHTGERRFGCLITNTVIDIEGVNRGLVWRVLDGLDPAADTFQHEADLQTSRERREGANPGLGRLRKDRVNGRKEKRGARNEERAERARLMDDSESA